MCTINPVMSVLISNRKEDRDTHRRRWLCEDGSRDYSYEAPSQGLPAAPEARERNRMGFPSMSPTLGNKLKGENPP